MEIKGAVAMTTPVVVTKVEKVTSTRTSITLILMVAQNLRVSFANLQIIIFRHALTWPPRLPTSVQDGWNEVLDLVSFARQTTPHASTKESPAYIL